MNITLYGQAYIKSDFFAPFFGHPNPTNGNKNKEEII